MGLIYKDLENQTAELVAKLDCVQDAILGNTTGVTTSTVNETVINTTGSGTIISGLYSYSIANIGAAAALVDGVVLPIGAVVSFSGYYDDFSRVFVRPSGITYDAQTSTLLITQTP